MDVKRDLKTLMWVPLGTVVIILSIIGYTNGEPDSSENKSKELKYYYVCPPEFLRIANSCYYFSTISQTWQDSHFACKDLDSNLTAPYRWEDRNLREYLSRSNSDKEERWIGGRYDGLANAWKWGGETREMKYQSFQRISHLSPETLQWHCVAMIPEYEFRWDAKSCLEKKRYICQTKLRKVRRSERNRLREKWKTNGNGYKPNEIAAPKNTISLQKKPIYKTPHRNPKKNINPTPNNNTPYVSIVNNEQRYNVANALRKSNNTNRAKNLNRPRNRQRNVGDKLYDPESVYHHNLNALRSGKTGMTNAQINKHLRRLERLRRREESQLRRAERMRERQNRERNELNNYDPNLISGSPNNIQSRNVDGKKNKSRKGKKFNNPTHSIDNVTQRTYLENNQISELHPKTIVEVHDFS